MALPQLADLMNLERLDETLYRGISWDLGFRALFGGQVLGQSLVAATATVPDDRYCHSYHSYFLLPGNAASPVIYEVENVRDGGSFSTRRVKAIQNGKNIFYMTASFQTRETNLTHQYATMPIAPSADSLQNDADFYLQNPQLVGKGVRSAVDYHRAIDLRTVDALQPYSSEQHVPLKQVWLKSNETLPTHSTLHQAVLAYASDFHFLGTALQPHGVAVNDPKLRIATIDHAIWFHQPIDMNEWHLYSMESPVSGNARALVNGKIFNQRGELVASTTQEGLMRYLGEQ
ncbi:acyl-CoA thioesterase [Alteromonas oceanisediminis]|uniref:acyl-CoA thioesterase n=1 Tax=Alteromonas oceanisediminis TaxID=2836180 RepID=UPI001BDA3D0A|nr:acyl-CoA thioesterase II [Alteromonas oceanisediminis]MBT0587132.1 acyl-CoA thioesterase II [Alteromonas oceanisediminis]